MPIKLLIGINFSGYLDNWVIAHNVLWLCLALPTCQDAQQQVAPIGGVEYNPHYAKSFS